MARAASQQHRLDTQHALERRHAAGPCYAGPQQWRLCPDAVLRAPGQWLLQSRTPGLRAPWESERLLQIPLGRGPCRRIPSLTAAGGEPCSRTAPRKFIMDTELNTVPKASLTYAGTIFPLTGCDPPSTHHLLC